MGPLDVTRVITRIEEIRGNTRAKIFEAANRLPVSPPILKEIEGQGLIGALSDRLPEGGILQGKGPILSRFLGAGAGSPSKEPGSAPNLSTSSPLATEQKKKSDDLYSDASIQM
jgi:hypothetical protein